MQLDEFIQGALTQIAEGVYRANVKLLGTEAPTGNIPFLMELGNEGGKATGIAFDVAVTTKAAAQGEGSGKFRIFVVDASADGKASFEREQVSRISFTVGVDKRIGYAFAGWKQQP